MSPEIENTYTKYICTIYIKGQTLSTVDTATYLGVELHVSLILTWNKKVEKVAVKANRTFGFIRRTVTTSSFEAKEVAYKTLVQYQLQLFYALVAFYRAQLLASR